MTHKINKLVSNLGDASQVSQICSLGLEKYQRKQIFLQLHRLFVHTSQFCFSVDLINELN